MSKLFKGTYKTRSNMNSYLEELEEIDDLNEILSKIFNREIDFYKDKTFLCMEFSEYAYNIIKILWEEGDL